jgi:hypothetical protein
MNGRLITRFNTQLDALLIEVLNFITGDYLPPGGKGAIYSTATDCSKAGT